MAPMLWSQLFIPTLREDPADAEAVSHRLMLRAGFIRQLGAGIYSMLPLGYRVIRKIEAIVREEMAGIGAQEFLLPAHRAMLLVSKKPADLLRRFESYMPPTIEKWK